MWVSRKKWKAIKKRTIDIEKYIQYQRPDKGVRETSQPTFLLGVEEMAAVQERGSRKRWSTLKIRQGRRKKMRKHFLRSRSKDTKKNNVTIIIQAETEKEAETLMKDIKKAVLRENCRMNNEVGYTIFCEVRKQNNF